MGSFSIWHWLIVLAVVVVIFGTKKLRNVGGDLGAAVKGFKDGMKGAQDVADADAKAAAQLVLVNGRTVTGVWLTTGTNSAAMKTAAKGSV